MSFWMKALILAGLPCVLPASVSIESQLLYVDGQRFHMRGVQYIPMNPGEELDTRVYSMLRSDRWRFDVDVMRSLGINTIRLEDYTSDEGDLTPMLDYLYNDGCNAIYVIFNLKIAPNLDLTDSVDTSPYLSAFSNLVEQYGSHPSALMYAIDGRFNDVDTYLSEINSAINLLQQFRGIAQDASDPSARLPITSPLIDDDVSCYFLFGLAEFAAVNDVFSILSYRGMSFGGFSNNVVLKSTDAMIEPKPLAFLNYGVDAANTLTLRPDIRSHADYLVSQMGTIDYYHSSFDMDLYMEERQAGGEITKMATTVGGVIQEFTDNWWRCNGRDDGSSHHSLCADAWDTFDDQISLEYMGLFEIEESRSTFEAKFKRIARPAVENVQETWGENIDSQCTSPTENQLEVFSDMLGFFFYQGGTELLTAQDGFNLVVLDVDSMTLDADVLDPVRYSQQWGPNTSPQTICTGIRSATVSYPDPGVIIAVTIQDSESISHSGTLFGFSGDQCGLAPFGASRLNEVQRGDSYSLAVYVGCVASKYDCVDEALVAEGSSSVAAASLYVQSDLVSLLEDEMNNKSPPSTSPSSTPTQDLDETLDSTNMGAARIGFGLSTCWTFIISLILPLSLSFLCT